MSKFEQAMNNIYEEKANYPKGSYENPYLFVCSEDIANVIKNTLKVDKNNIFTSGGFYTQLCIQKPLNADITLEIEELENE